VQTDENGDILGKSVHGPVRSGWLVEPALKPRRVLELTKGWAFHIFWVRRTVRASWVRTLTIKFFMLLPCFCYCRVCS